MEKMAQKLSCKIPKRKCLWKFQIFRVLGKIKNHLDGSISQLTSPCATAICCMLKILFFSSPTLKTNPLFSSRSCSILSFINFTLRIFLDLFNSFFLNFSLTGTAMFVATSSKSAQTTEMSRQLLTKGAALLGAWQIAAISCKICSPYFYLHCSLAKKQVRCEMRICLVSLNFLDSLIW